ncbi:hypothetical protein VNI00_002521 [Paramarasmius palmivorus]|uniref:HMG box domain-containing protein n=1 Tax=Paramarasmius palmivorus TaxID=297713 RepID=A0AAW0DUQ2_9AGAR
MPSTESRSPGRRSLSRSPTPFPSFETSPDDEIRRPPNAFMMFRSDILKKGVFPTKESQRNVSRAVGMRWQSLAKSEKDKWRKKAAEKLREFHLKYPTRHTTHYYCTTSPRNMKKRKNVKRPPTGPRKEHGTADSEDAHMDIVSVPPDTQPVASHSGETVGMINTESTQVDHGDPLVNSCIEPFKLLMDFRGEMPDILPTSSENVPSASFDFSFGNSFTGSSFPNLFPAPLSEGNLATNPFTGYMPFELAGDRMNFLQDISLHDGHAVV